MKKSEMDPKVAYIECPNHECEKWWDDKIHCEYDCPEKSKLKKLVKCWNCKEIIELPIDYSGFRRIDHKCSDGRTPFQLATGITILREKIGGYK